MSSALKKKIKPGLIELDPSQPTIIVHLTSTVVDPSQPDEDGKPLVVSSTAEQRRFKLKSFTPTSNVPKFAAAFIAKCELIHESKQRHVEALLTQLAERLRAGGADEFDDMIPSSASPRPSPSPKANLNSTAPVSLSTSSAYDSSYASSSSLSTTAPVALHTRRSKATKPLDDDDEEKEPDTPPTPSFKVPKSPLTPLRSDRPSSRISPVADDSDEEDRRGRRKGREEVVIPRSRRAEPEPKEEKVREKPGRLTTKDRYGEEDASTPSPTRSNRSDSRGSPDPSRKDGERERERERRPASRVRQRDPSEPLAYLDSMDAYIEQLYDDTAAKVASTSALLQLISNPQHFPYFVQPQHANVFEILSRVLGEERKKSVDLVSNIVDIFACLARYTDFHPLVVSNRVGDMSMKVVALELKRFDVRWEEVQGKGKRKLDKATAAFVGRQDRLLTATYWLLLYLSEDVAIEMKMKERDLIHSLVRTLQRSASLLAMSGVGLDSLDELTVLTLSFLKKLSIFEENKTEMVAFDLTAALRPFLSQDGAEAREVALRLLYNLSFDDKQRERMVRLDYLPLCVDVVRRASRGDGAQGRRLTAVAVRVLYSLSMDLQWRPQVQRACAPALTALVQLAVDGPGKWVDLQLVALLVNVTRGGAGGMEVGGEALHAAMKRLQQTLDPLLLRLLHHLTTYCPAVRGAMGRYAAELVGLCVKVGVGEGAYDALGVLGNVGEGVEFSELLLQFNFAPQLARLLGGGDEDLRLQGMRVVGVVASSEAAARKVVAGGGVVRGLVGVLRGGEGGVDAVAQGMWALWRLVRWGSGRAAVCGEEGAMEAVGGWMESEVKAVRELALLCCEEVMEESEEWRERMKGLRFERFNRRWMEALGLRGKGMGGKGKGGGRGGGGGQGTGRGKVSDDADEYSMQRPKTAGKAKALLGRRDGSRKGRSRSASPTHGARSRSPSI